MDYRLLDPVKVLWLRTARGLKVTYPGIPSLTMQTPRVLATLTEPIPGLRNLEIEFSDQCPSFAGFLRGCDESATKRMLEWWPGNRRIDTLRGWSDTWSLKDFGECLYFDADGKALNTEPLGRYECSAIVKLTGTWTKGSDIWGMKWDLVQIKVYAPVTMPSDDIDDTETTSFTNDDGSGDTVSYGFIDDDDEVRMKKKQRGCVEMEKTAYGFLADD